MNNKEVYTTGNSFRAIAEANAREYRKSILQLTVFDKYGHILDNIDAEKGMNFLPSLRNEILDEVKKRNSLGKGIDMVRTTKNMLSSQAMCFNLFAPLNKDLAFATQFFKQLLGNVSKITKKIQYEYTPSKTIFNDQSGRGGVDCDSLLTYTNDIGQESILVIETKYVEPDFSNCGFRKRDHDDRCPLNTILEPDLSNCRYHYKKRYNYWKVAEESNLFNMDLITRNPCPFGGHLWQLWTNMSLAYALAKEKGISEYYYAVVCPEENDMLSNNGKIFDMFRDLLKYPEKFKVIYLSDIKLAFDTIDNKGFNKDWTNEFIQRYC